MHNIPHRQQYRIQIRGHIPASWSDWFDGLALTQQPDGVTVINGSFPDQAALFGMLWRIRDLGIPLISVVSVENEERKYE